MIKPAKGKRVRPDMPKHEPKLCPACGEGPHLLDSGCPATVPDWSGNCEVCGESPIMPVTGMCGPCTFGEAETVGGNW